MDTKQIRIALVGHPLSGKDTVGEYLAKQYGFLHVSTGQLVRDYIAKNNLGDATRDLMKKVAIDVRKAMGVDFFLNQALDTKSPRLAINGLRARGEIEAAKSVGCTIIATVAPIESRYQWAKGRGRVSDGVSFDKFKEQEDAESRSTDNISQNVEGAIEFADYKLENYSTFESLYLAVDKLMAKLGVDKHES